MALFLHQHAMVSEKKIQTLREQLCINFLQQELILFNDFFFFLSDLFLK